MSPAPAGCSVEAIVGPQGSGRSLRLARRVAEVTARRGPCLVVDPSDHWSGSHHARLPDDAVVLRSSALMARGVDPAEVMAIAMYRLPGAVVGIDDAESLGLDRRGWARVYAAAAATGCLLIVVLAEGADGYGRGARLPGPGRVSALAAHGG